MNLIEIAENLKDVPDQYLLQEVQRPTGNFPAYLVVSELGRRKRMRESVAKEMPQTTVVEDLTAPQRQQAMAQMSQMTQDQNMIPQAGGLNALPQAQQDLAAIDMMSAQPQMPEVPAMAGGGMVSFKQGGDVIRAFDGLPDEFFTSSTDQPSISRSALTDLMTLPELQEYNRSGVVPERLRSTIGTTLVESGSFLGGLPFSRAPAQFPVAAVAPEPRPVATASTTTPTTPAGAPSGAPAPADQTRPLVPPLALRQTSSLPPALTDYAIQTARAQRLADYEQAVPDTLTPMFAKQIESREKDIAARRASNINEALMRAGLGIMASKSPRFLQAAGEGGMAGLGTFREGLKDIRQSEELNTAARMKMAEAEMLRGERKFKAADDAERSARENQRDAVALANTESAMALRDLQGQIAAQRAPFDILESQARAAAYGKERPGKVNFAESMDIATAKIDALKELGIKDYDPNNAAQRNKVEQRIAEILASRGLSYNPRITPALDRGNLP